MITNIVNMVDIIHGTVYLSKIESNITSTALFNRLHYISQASTVYLTFPSNNSKRFDHSIGTMKLCGDILFHSISNTNKPTLDYFMTSLKQEISMIYTTFDESMPNNLSSFFNEDDLAKGFPHICDLNLDDGIYHKFIPSNIEITDRNYFIILFESIRICGLLHDIGHPPYSHIVEEGLEEAYKIVQDNSSLKESLKTIYKNKKKLHESIGDNLFWDISYDVFKMIENDTYSKKFFYLLVFQIAADILSEKNNFFKDLHKIISGSLDADRLDNINRDALSSGFDTSIMNYNQFIDSMVLFGDNDHGYKFCPNMKTLLSIEECFEKRWKNYKRMTHHHKVIMTNNMLKEIIKLMSVDFCNKNDVKEKSTSISLPYNISGLWLPLSKTSSNKKRKIRFIQWTDNWLITILQKKYMEMFMDQTKKNKEEKRLYYFLEELIENKRNYHSLIKRYEDYKTVDNCFKENFAEYLIDFQKKCKEFDEKVDSGEISTNRKKPAFELKNFISDFVNINCKNGSFLSSQISYIISCYFSYNLFDILSEEITNNFINDNRNLIDDCFFVSRNLKPGTDKVLHMYDEYDKDTKLFVDVSHIDETLRLEQSYIPEFYVYIKWIDCNQIDNNIINKVRMKLGQILSDHVIKYLDDFSSKYLQLKSTII